MAVKVLRKWSRAEATRRATRAWTLRTEGYSWDEVAELCGYASASTACRSVRTWREGLPPMDRERLRDEAVGRLSWLLRRAYEDVAENRPGAVTAAVRVEQRLSELVGLDQPTEVVLHTPTAHELEQWVSRVVASQVPDVVECDVIGEIGPGDVLPELRPELLED